MTRSDLVDRWFALTRDEMPGIAGQRDWPVRFDHCFQRILLDNAVGAKWSGEIPAPAYRHASDDTLERAIALGRGAIDGTEDLVALNRNSLAWRDKR
ncbi:GCN5-related N-acetyltransferase [Qipengyuania sp. XHP0207]|uniref:GCN5-related N-acetyltransferase n=1 Tax=Qipengyuania sp. XHP0207 TaxID=3038078 RepID=UPI00241CEA50|nr:GCN5-related N-acetyltransferase [Qipengyuania sp. XHP0207]MDG5747221.1 GCN5-related N-acetyltransferase [Qipengyuania sp. XHP0207]